MDHRDHVPSRVQVPMEQDRSVPQACPLHEDVLAAHSYQMDSVDLTTLAVRRACTKQATQVHSSDHVFRWWLDRRHIRTDAMVMIYRTHLNDHGRAPASFADHNGCLLHEERHGRCLYVTEAKPTVGRSFVRNNKGARKSVVKISLSEDESLLRTWFYVVMQRRRTR